MIGQPSSPGIWASAARLGGVTREGEEITPCIDMAGLKALRAALCGRCAAGCCGGADQFNRRQIVARGGCWQGRSR
jgi:hypothetical protein